MKLLPNFEYANKHKLQSPIDFRKNHTDNQQNFEIDKLLEHIINEPYERNKENSLKEFKELEKFLIENLKNNNNSLIGFLQKKIKYSKNDKFLKTNSHSYFSKRLFNYNLKTLKNNNLIIKLFDNIDNQLSIDKYNSLNPKSQLNLYRFSVNSLKESIF